MLLEQRGQRLIDAVLVRMQRRALAYVLLKDRAGRRYDSPNRKTRDPVPGNDATLTLDAELQEIGERGLDDAIAQMKAEGGDVVFLDPNSGELLALASRQADAEPGRGDGRRLGRQRRVRHADHRQR